MWGVAGSGRTVAMLKRILRGGGGPAQLTILRFLAGKVVQTMQICIYNEYTYIPPAQLAQYYSDSHHLRT